MIPSKINFHKRFYLFLLPYTFLFQSLVSDCYAVVKDDRRKQVTNTSIIPQYIAEQCPQASS